MFFISVTYQHCKGFFSAIDWHVQKDSQRTQLRGSFLRSVLASDYFWCYAKYTSNILNFTLCNFKELIISPEIQPPIQEKKNSSRREKLNYRHTTNFHHHFSLPWGSVTSGYLGLKCTMVLHQEWNTLFSSSSND